MPKENNDMNSDKLSEMSNESLISKIRYVIKGVHKNRANFYFKNHFNDLYVELEQRTLFLNKFKKTVKKCEKIYTHDISIFERLYCLEHNLVDRPLCKTCLKKYVEWRIDKYNSFCSHKCSSVDEYVKIKHKNTNIDRYGVENVSQLQSTKEKYKNTCLEKYGVDHPFKDKSILEKRKHTWMETYGVDHPFKRNDILNKRIQTYFWNYGCEHPMKNKDIISNYKHTNIKKYGSSCSLYSNCVNDKMIEKFFTFNDRELYKYDGEKRITFSQLNSYKNILNSNYDIPVFSFSDFLNRKPDDYLKFKCKKCGKEYISIHRDGKHKMCPTCFPMNKMSYEELELFEYISSLYSGGIIENGKIIKPYELDIYVPDMNMAFEFDGLYWHSENERESSYHLMKTNLCEDKGIHLIHIFENEWLSKQDIVKQYIKSLFGIYDKRIFARKCEVKEIPNNEANDFLDLYHLQGRVPSTKVALGLFYKNELISVMTFCKARVNKQCEWELSRFVCKGGYHVIGGAGKLLKYFERNYKPKSLVSYADRRWTYSKKNLYLTLGFELTKIGKPDYMYFLPNKVYETYHKMNFRKNRIKKIFPEMYDDNLTEKEMMKNLGYLRIYDSGHLTFVKTYCNK